MNLYWLVYRHNNQTCVVIEPAASLIHARMRAALAEDAKGDDWATIIAGRSEAVIG
jgi:hypothetical protein